MSAGDLQVCSIVGGHRDRKSTRLNSSHSQISYAVFCLKKKKNNERILCKLHNNDNNTAYPINPKSVLHEHSKVLSPHNNLISHIQYSKHVVATDFHAEE